MRQLVLFVSSVILLLTTGCSSVPAPGATVENGWLKLEAGAFSLYAPPGWEFHKKQGIDSDVGEFAGNGIVLKFDYGRYSNPLDEAREPKYVVARENVGGHKAKVVYPREPGQGITGIYFSRVPGSNRLCLWAQDLTDSQRDLALKIFRTVRFP